MEVLQEYIKKYDIKIPDYLERSHKNISIALDKGDINLLKSIIAYKNHLKRMENDADRLDILLNND
tara:strand:- start:1834 stop:2031 length:198 start_codon:yes stop_codon:yes gene_type:complete